MRYAELFRPATLALALCLWPATIAAQAVEGVIRAAPGGEPLAGAVILLTTTDGTRLRGTLSDEAGRYRLAAPSPGSYALRIDVVGYRSVTVADLHLDAGVEAHRDLMFRFERVALPRVTVAVSSRCTAMDGHDAADAAGLWSEARKALEAAQLAIEEHRFTVTVRRYERTIGLPDSTVRAIRTWTQTAVTTNPFESLPPDSAARAGFVVRQDSSSLYYAPDAAILLSDAFVTGHCFGTRSSGPAGAVGLTFRPQALTNRVDIDGVLWLDSATAELRSLEYRYVPSVGRPPVGGGNVAFGRYPTGQWGVRSWAIRLPVLRVTESRRRPDGALGRFVDTVVTALREEGGEVLTSVAPLGAATRLTGVVFDSTLGTPLAGATVTLEGFARAVRTDAQGRFVVDSLPDGGEARVRVSHPRLDSLGLGAPVRMVRIRRGQETTEDIAVPGVSAVARARCRSSDWASSRVVTGLLQYVDDSTPAANVDVTLLERRTSDGGGTDILRRFTGYSNDVGRYAFCAAAPGSATWLVAHGEAGWGVPVFVGLEPPPVSIVPLGVPGRGAQADSSLMRYAPGGTILGRTINEGAPRIAGWVLRAPDATGAVDILLDGAARGSTFDDGAFRIDPITGGMHTLVFRAPGHDDTRLSVQVEPAQSQLLLVVLRQRPVVVVQRQPGMRSTWLDEFQRRRRAGNGVFFDRSDLVARNAQSLADVLRTVPGVRVLMGNQGNRYVSARFRRLGPPIDGDDGSACEMMFYVDGQPFPVETASADVRIRVSEIAAMEVYASATSVPRQFAGATAACGVIVIWRG